MFAGKNRPMEPKRADLTNVNTWCSRETCGPTRMNLKPQMLQIGQMGGLGSPMARAWKPKLHQVPALFPPGDSWSPVLAHGELGCRRLRKQNAELAPDSRRRERRWIHIRGACGNAEDGVKSAFCFSHPIRHEFRK